MYKLRNCSLRGSYAVGFRAPTLKEMYSAFDMGSIWWIYGNEHLKPEKVIIFPYRQNISKAAII